MKFIVALSLLGLMGTSGTHVEIDCSLTVTYAEMAFANYKKAHQSESLDDAKPYIKKAIEESTQSAAYAVASSCHCITAETYALSAVAFGQKAEKAEDLKTLQKFTKKAMNMSLDVMTAIPNCK